MSEAPTPPAPFKAADEWLHIDEQLYRVHSNVRTVTEFNPGYGAPTRFAFFTDEHDKTVPVLYAAGTEEAAVAESLLHDTPAAGGTVTYGTYADKVMGRLSVTRDLRLAKLRGLGLRRLKIEAQDLTDTDASEYPRTVRWAQAAHKVGFEGLAWSACKCNDTRAVILFGDRCGGALRQDDSFARIFQTGPGLDWLIAICDPLHVDVLPPAPRR